MLKQGGFFFPGQAMQYSKPPLDISAQIQKLQNQGLAFPDMDRAERNLAHIGYYRLSAYFIPFQKISSDDKPSRTFMPLTTFEDVLNLYIFDRKLRILVMEAIERIEVAVRSQWGNALSLSENDSHAYMKPELFKSPSNHARAIDRLSSENEVSKEPFVVHYKQKYTTPFLPPVWAIVETMSFGILSRWFADTKDAKLKQKIASALGLPTAEIMETVLHVLTLVRNICAHHGRLWNRRLVLQLPHIKHLARQMQYDDKTPGQRQPTRMLCNILVVMIHIMSVINPGSSWKQRLRTHIQTLPSDFHFEMGLPDGWETQKPWSETP